MKVARDFEALQGVITFFAKLRPDVVVRIFLASDLVFLVPDLVAMGCEVRVMATASPYPAPGEMWPFLALSHQGLVTVVDWRETPNPLRAVERTEGLAAEGLGFWREAYTSGEDETRRAKPTHYRPIRKAAFGSVCSLPMRELMEAFLLLSERGEFSPELILGERKRKKVHGYQWPGEGFAEWFLLAVVFPRMAIEGVCTYVAREDRSLNQWFALDIDYSCWAHPRAAIRFQGVEGEKRGQETIESARQMAWNELFPQPTLDLLPEAPTEGTDWELNSDEWESWGLTDQQSLVCTSLPSPIEDYHLEILEKGIQRLREEVPECGVRVYLKEEQRDAWDRLRALGCELVLIGSDWLPRELAPLLALTEERVGGTTFTEWDRFWYAVDDVKRTSLLASAGVSTWRVLDTWSASPESYCALQSHGWGTIQRLEVRELLLRVLAERKSSGREERFWARDFLTEALHPLLVSGGYLSLMIPRTPPARYWVAVDLEYCQRNHPASELVMAPQNQAFLEEEERIPSLIYKGYEMPVAGVYSCHQSLPVFSHELAAVQECLLETLDAFHRFAKREGIRYSMHAANLTGYYTSGGFLPWDDDIDLTVHPHDFPKLRRIWEKCPSAERVASYHRGFENVLTRHLELEGRLYEFIENHPQDPRTLMKIRPVGCESIFTNDVGGVDLTTIHFADGEWRDGWSREERRPTLDNFETALEEVVFDGVTTMAFRREAVEEVMREKYPFDWGKHPRLQRENSRPIDALAGTAERSTPLRPLAHPTSASSTTPPTR
ncbi:LicD family protein [Roseibacillus persicicus]|uniref:LicD family protein n=1 Tax=Roseibacillus persicicus TaxID=454148 RepID=UPI00398A7ED4